MPASSVRPAIALFTAGAASLVLCATAVAQTAPVSLGDVSAVTNAWKKAGGEVITVGGEPINMGALTLVVLRDPNGLMLKSISAPWLPASWGSRVYLWGGRS
jgi:hypothetical protein